MKTKKFVFLAVLSVLMLVMGASLTTAQDAKVIKIASQSPLSGPQAVLGVSISNAVRLAVTQMSGPLADMGYTIEYVPFDDQATPDVGVANAQNIVNDPAIMAVVGHLNSGVAIPSSEVYNQNNLAMVSPANTNVNITDRYLPTVNRVAGRDDTQGSAGAAYAAEIGIKSVYVLHDNTAYGQGLAEFFKAEAEARGLSVLGFEGTSEASNFDSIATPIIALSPELIYFGGIYSQTAIFIKAARDLGYTGKFMGGDGFDSSEFSEIAGEAAVGTLYTSVAAPVTFYEAAAQFAADYKAEFGEDPQPFAAQAYDSAGIVIKALELAVARSGGTLPAETAKARALVASIVRSTSGYEGLTGSYSFDAVGDAEEANYYIIEVTSADPAAWGGNSLISEQKIASPLYNAEKMLMGGM